MPDREPLSRRTRRASERLWGRVLAHTKTKPTDQLNVAVPALPRCVGTGTKITTTQHTTKFKPRRAAISRNIFLTNQPFLPTPTSVARLRYALRRGIRFLIKQSLCVSIAAYYGRPAVSSADLFTSPRLSYRYQSPHVLSAVPPTSTSTHYPTAPASVPPGPLINICPVLLYAVLIVHCTMQCCVPAWACGSALLVIRPYLIIHERYRTRAPCHRPRATDANCSS